GEGPVVCSHRNGSPEGVRSERVFSEDERREVDCVIVADAESLLAIARLGAVSLEVWASRMAGLARADWCLLDLDPRGAPLDRLAPVAREIRALADEMGMPSYVKTSGAIGLHVLLPLGGLCTFEQARSLGELVARVVAGRLPTMATTVRGPLARGRVSIDFLQN